MRTNSTRGLPETGSAEDIAFDQAGIRRKLLALALPCHFVSRKGLIGATNGPVRASGDLQHLLSAPPLPIERLGAPEFLACHGVHLAYAAGAMAGGIASEELVIALGRARILASFGAGGLPPQRVEAAIGKIQQALPGGPYAFNLLHSPNEPRLERQAVDLYLRHQIRTVEASAFLDLTPNVVCYRAAGLHRAPDGRIVAANKIIAKLSRKEVAVRFLQPPPEALLRALVEEGRISSLQAELARQLPMADDITVEADSGGHTDNRPLVNLLPAILALRDQLQMDRAARVRVGAAGGIGTPEAALAAFMMGADYVVTGSINQSCREAGTSPFTRQLLTQAEMTDVTMAPAADMFELGVRLQVLKRGTFFAMRAQKLYELYRTYDALEAIPEGERQKLEAQVFRRSLAAIWEDTRRFFQTRDPEQLARAEANPRHKMALVFRWYLGLSSRWSNTGEPGREADYQIWCGPAMGAFNDWVRGSYLASTDNRGVVDVALQIMTGAAFYCRLQSLRLQGLQVPAAVARYVPEYPLA